jgi:hypothetical protein
VAVTVNEKEVVNSKSGAAWMERMPACDMENDDASVPSKPHVTSPTSAVNVAGLGVRVVVFSTIVRVAGPVMVGGEEVVNSLVKYPLNTFADPENPNVLYLNAKQ